MQNSEFIKRREKSNYKGIVPRLIQKFSFGLLVGVCICASTNLLEGNNSKEERGFLVYFFLGGGVSLLPGTHRG